MRFTLAAAAIPLAGAQPHYPPIPWAPDDFVHAAMAQFSLPEIHFIANCWKRPKTRHIVA